MPKDVDNLLRRMRTDYTRAHTLQEWTPDAQLALLELSIQTEAAANNLHRHFCILSQIIEVEKKNEPNLAAVANLVEKCRDARVMLHNLLKPPVEDLEASMRAHNGSETNSPVRPYPTPPPRKK